MDKFVNEIMEKRVEACKKALEQNHIKTFVVDDAAMARDLVNEMIKDHEQVCDGGSMTLIETGIIDLLNQRDIQFHTHSDTSMSRAESDAESRKAYSADTFITSSNAITLDGEIINVDGHGNRVSAMIFGPKQVIIVAGYNKIVQNEQQAIERIKTLAAPANCVRLQRTTPCRFVGECKDCKSEERICSSYVKLNFDREDRLRVILMKEDYGY